jgi:LuxR family maltose regulon positive regulatory protein
MNQTRFAKSQFSLPERGGNLLTRRRLLEKMEEALDRKLTLISAPSGYGKTSLLIDFCHAADFPCCWYSIDEADRDFSRFALGLANAIGARFPGFETRLESQIETVTIADSEAMEGLIVAFANEIYDRVLDHFVLVLDDFHWLNGKTDIEYFVNRLLHLSGDNLHLIVASRSLIVFRDISLFVARNQAHGLNSEELAFRPDEIRKLIRQSRGIDISESEADALAFETEGWIAGLHFFQPNTRTALPANASVRLAEFFERQMFERQSDETRGFLLYTSVFDDFDKNICASVLFDRFPFDTHWETLIDKVAKSDLFVVSGGAPTRWLRYHRLFRNYLFSRLSSERPDEIPILLRRIREYYEKTDNWDRAWQVCRQINDLDESVKFLERAEKRILSTRFISLADWLDELPPQIAIDNPAMVRLRASTMLMKGDANDQTRLLRWACDQFKASGDRENWAITALRLSMAHRYISKYKDALRAANEAARVAKSARLRQYYAEAQRLKGIALYRMGKTAQSIKAFEHALYLFLHIDDHRDDGHLTMELGMAYGAFGDRRKRLDLYNKALKFFRRYENVYMQSMTLNNIGCALLEDGKYEESFRAFMDGKNATRHIGHKRTNALLSVGLGDLFEEIGDIESARRNYRDAEETRAGDDAFLRFFVLMGEAKLALMTGDLDAAKRLATEAETLIASSSASEMEKGVLRTIQGRISLHEENYFEAADAFRNACLSFGNNLPTERDIARIWLATAHCAAGRTGAARQILKSTLCEKRTTHSLVVAVGKALPWLGELRQDAGLADAISRAERHRAELPIVWRQIERLSPSNERGTMTTVFVRTFGATAVFLNGRQLTPADWQTRSALEMFLFFLLNDDSFSKENAANILYPNIERPSQVNLRFKNDIYKLRHAVGQDSILFKDGFYSFNRALKYRYDFEEFEAFRALALSAASETERLSYLRKAAELVHGAPLNDVYAEWTAPFKERMQSAFAAFAMEFVGALSSERKFDEALAFAQRALNYDPTVEGLYRLQMTIHAARNERPAIVSAYKDCEYALWQYFSILPSRETVELYFALTEDFSTRKTLKR